MHSDFSSNIRSRIGRPLQDLSKNFRGATTCDIAVACDVFVTSDLQSLEVDVANVPVFVQYFVYSSLQAYLHSAAGLQ